MNLHETCSFIYDSFCIMSMMLSLPRLRYAIITMLITIIGIFLLSSNLVFGQISSGVQEWVDKENSIKILFSYSPEKPIIDSKTQMKFIVQNFTTNRNLNNILARVVVATNSSGQLRTFKFGNITSTSGNFTVNYIFPDSGLYQIITRIDSKNFSTLASFKVDVPFQSFGAVSSSGSFTYVIIIPVVIAVAAAISISILVVIRRRRQRIRAT
jgi:hypothetical protein